LARQVNLTKVRFFPAQQAREIPRILAAMDVPLISGKASFAIASVPSKIFKMMASGRSVVVASAIKESRDCKHADKDGLLDRVDDGGRATVDAYGKIPEAFR